MYLKYDNLEQYIGEMFGFWLVLSVGKPKLDRSKCRHRTLTCKCMCGKCNGIVKDVRFDHLRTERSKSCGFMNHSNIGKSRKKYNKYDLSGEYGIGWSTNTNQEFYFDLEDYEKIKDYCWNTDKNNYVKTVLKKENKKQITISMHSLIIIKENTKNDIDHINGIPYDNRKSNLRECTHSQNMKNMKLPLNNTSGDKGVYYRKDRDTWMAKIFVDGKKIHLGSFKNKEDAIKVIKQAEEKYFKEFNREEQYL